MKSRADGTVIGIDLLRIFAALAVVVYHLGFKSFADPNGIVPLHLGQPATLPAGWPAMWWGWVGVQVFFVVSGWVIARSATVPGITAARFARRRFLRLFPVLLIAVLFAALIEGLWFARPLDQIPRLSFLTLVFAPLPPWIMGQFWTIGIELSFYALICLMIMMGRIGLLPAVGRALIVACAGYWLLRLAGGGDDGMGRLTQLALLQHGAYFGMGILLAEGSAICLRRTHFPWLAGGAAIAALQIAMAAGWEVGDLGIANLWPVAWVVFLAAVALAALAACHNDRITDWLGPHAQRVRLLGLATYPLYLTHVHAGRPVLVECLKLGLSPALATACATLAAVLVALAIARWIEPPVHSAMARLFSRAAQARPA